MGLPPAVVCIDHQGLQTWHKEHVDMPSGPACRCARWHETLDKDNTAADCKSPWAYRGRTGMVDASAHGDEGETRDADHADH